MTRTLKLGTFRYGEPPRRGQGLRIGTTRRPPRGATKKEWGEYFDVWFPVLAPSDALLRRTRQRAKFDYKRFCASYEKELLGKAETRQAVELLAALALRMPISVGCFCEDESVYHRSHLRKLIERTGRRLKP